MKRKKLLVVGSIPDENNLLNYGGATVLMKNYLDYLASQSEYEYRFVQNNRYSNLRTRQRSMWRNYSYFFPAFLWRLFGCDIVMFNFSDHGTIYYFPLLSKIARLAHKKVVLRKFGGSFEFYIKKIGQTQLQRALDAIRQTDLIFFETQQGITHLQQCKERVTIYIGSLMCVKLQQYERTPQTFVADVFSCRISTKKKG